MIENNQKEVSSLTKHPEGSVRELLYLSLPLMLSLLSENIMLFFDRLILAHYSLDAMNAAAAASFFCCILQYATVAIAAISEIFVGQFNSSGQKEKASWPVWQMIWFSLFSFMIFIPAALWGGDFLLSPYHKEELALPYYQWFLYFGPFFTLVAAFSGFFIGIGKTKVVTITVILGNLFNIALDVLLIFGVPGMIPSMGTKGAAIATGISQLLQVVVLAAIFFNASHRKRYNTLDCSVRPKLFSKCLRIGSPNAVGYMMEMTCWAFIARLAASKGEDFITVLTVGQSIYTLLAFALDGIQRGVCMTSASFLGSNKKENVVKTWKSASKVIFLIAGVFSIFLVFYPDPLIKQFLTSEIHSENYQNTLYLLQMSSIIIWLYIIIDGHSCISTGVLIASGDIAYVLIVDIIYICFFTFLPIYVLTTYFDSSPLVIWTTVTAASFLDASLNYFRFRQNKWSAREPITREQ